LKRLVISICLVAALVVPAIALARTFPPDSDYQGRVEGDPNTYFGFDRDRIHGHRMIRHIAFSAPINCYSGDHGIVKARIPGKFKIERGLFGVPHVPRVLRHLRFFFADGPIHLPYGDGTAEAFGNLLGDNRAGGELRVVTHSDTLGKCYSGILGWRAKRGAEVAPPP
jgi:hypothetical protein